MDPTSHSLLLTAEFVFASSGMDMTVSANSVTLKYHKQNKAQYIVRNNSKLNFKRRNKTTPQNNFNFVY